jgi:hypothetical protein
MSSDTETHKTTTMVKGRNIPITSSFFVSIPSLTCPSCPLNRQPLICVLLSEISLNAVALYVNKVIQYVLFLIWFISLRISLLIVSIDPYFLWVVFHILLSIFACWWTSVLFCFLFLTITNEATMKILCKSWCGHILLFLWGKYHKVERLDSYSSCGLILFLNSIFFLYCCVGWGYIMAFIKVLTMYQICHTLIHPLHQS